MEMIQQSEQLKSAAENKAAHFADRLVPYILAGSAVTWLLTRNVIRALSVLMVDFSCPLKLSMPLAVLSAMREAGSCRITVKGGKHLEAVAHADIIVLDKTGTMTHACPVVAEEERDKFEALPSEYSHLYLSIGGRMAAVICVYDLSTLGGSLRGMGNLVDGGSKSML